MKRFWHGALLASLCLPVAVLCAPGDGFAGSSTVALLNSSSSSTTTRTSGPPSATLGLVGGTELTGPVVPNIIHCAEPTLDGTEILVIGTPVDSNLSVRISVLRGKVSVGVDTGSGAQYEERDFVGTGVAHFVATHGARIKSSLAPVPPAAGTTVPNLPSVTSIAGTISCAGQTPGSSTLTVVGTTEAGRVSGRIGPVFVTCSPGPQVLIIGNVKVGRREGFIDVSVFGGVVSLFIASGSVQGQQYRAPVGSGAATTGGASINGNAVEMVASGATAHSLRVVGHATCGQNPAP
jgi:hypothetical protein